MSDPASPQWNAANLHSPHAQADKRTRVQKMFSAIAPSYDLNNRLHSFWRDQAWRRKAVLLSLLNPDDVVLDIACGTGDLTLKYASYLALERARAGLVRLKRQVVGLDFTFEMLVCGNRKAKQLDERVGSQDGSDDNDWSGILHFVNGDAQNLPFPDACCDVISIAFGIRNVQDVSAALAEFYRVLRPGGRVIVLEFSEPTNPVLRGLNRFYCGKVMPITATLISRDKSGAYKYLPKSVETFLSRQQMVQHLAQAGFADLTQHPMTFGVCVCYRGYKR